MSEWVLNLLGVSASIIILAFGLWLFLGFVTLCREAWREEKRNRNG